MKEIQINDLEYANLEKLYDLVKCNEASVTCNGSKVLAFEDPEWSNIVYRSTIEELEEFTIQNQDAPDESPVITSKTVVESQGVGENWTSEYSVKKLSYFRDLLKKYKALILGTCNGSKSLCNGRSIPCKSYIPMVGWL